MTDWDDLQDRFKAVVNMRRRAGCSIDDVARAVPCGRTTVYELLNENVDRPRPSLERCIERFVKRASSVTGQPTSTPAEG